MTKESEVVKEDPSYNDEFDTMFSDPSKGADLTIGLKTTEEEDEDIIPDDKKEDTPPAKPEEDDNDSIRKKPHVEESASTRDQYTWIEGLPEEQREMAERLKHEVLSDRGRVSALTRKLNETTSELAAAKVHSTTVAPANEEADVATAPELSENLKQLQEDYPELGKQIAQIWAERETSLRKEFSDQIDPIKEAQTADAKASEQAQMEQAGSDIFKTEETGVYWKDVVNSEDFSAWLSMQPAFIQNTARTSNNPKDGIDVLRMYESDYQTALTSQQEPADDTSGKNTEQGDKIKARRRQRKATTVSPESQHVGTDADELTGDYDSMFDAMFGGSK